MRWNQFIGGVLIGLGFGLFLGGAIVDLTQKWNSTSAAGVSMLLVIVAAIATQRDRRKKQHEKPRPDP
jgi:predicted MFS family arabinose efflux permease